MFPTNGKKKIPTPPAPDHRIAVLDDLVKSMSNIVAQKHAAKGAGTGNTAKNDPMDDHELVKEQGPKVDGSEDELREDDDLPVMSENTHGKMPMPVKGKAGHPFGKHK